MTYSQKLKDPRWQKKRLEILNRDNFSCRHCGDNESTLHVHHISYQGDPWETDNKMLITLCESCHEQEEKDLKNLRKRLFQSLRDSGMTAYGIISIMALFEGAKDRGWDSLNDAFQVIDYCINNDDVWEKMRNEYSKQFK